jgi:beta-glucanase (GH16 family)
VKYGKIEGRMKIPQGQGLWPAFWMLGSNIDQMNWPTCGEIDVMEHINNETKVHGTAHWDNVGHQYWGGTIDNDPTQYHTYSIIWDSLKVKWYMDDIIYYQLNIANGVNGTEEFQLPFYLLLNLAVGGNWPGYPNGTTVFPAEMVVDYVRVYTYDANLSHGEDFLLPIYPTGRQKENHNATAKPCASEPFSDPLLYRGDKITINGVDIEVLLSGNFDRIRVTKAK